MEETSLLLHWLKCKICSFAVNECSMKQHYNKRCSCNLCRTKLQFVYVLIGDYPLGIVWSAWGRTDGWLVGYPLTNSCIRCFPCTVYNTWRVCISAAVFTSVRQSVGRSSMVQSITVVVCACVVRGYLYSTDTVPTSITWQHFALCPPVCISII
jgi:hypothetical protein